MLTRRAIVTATCGISFATIFRIRAHAQGVTEDSLAPLPSDLQDAAGEPDFFSLQLEKQQLGTADPGREKKEIAKRIMNGAPFNCRPIDVANYYRDIGLGSYGQEYRAYARGWPREYNPIIIELFKTTGLNPLAPEFDGDDTPWCAAFANYCIARACSKNGVIGAAELAKGTRSASSGSFRCFGKAVPSGESPRIGDLAVWALDGTVDGCKPGTGHVGFFAGMTNDPAKPYFIVGGNQSGDILSGEQTRRDGMILKPMPLKYLAKKNPPVYKTFQGFRTAEFL